MLYPRNVSYYWCTSTTQEHLSPLFIFESLFMRLVKYVIFVNFYHLQITQKLYLSVNSVDDINHLQGLEGLFNDFN